jgi:transposase InsO family protein
VDDGSRECPAIIVDHGLSAARVARELDRVAATRPLPETIVVDNGPEFTSRALDQWVSSGAGGRAPRSQTRPRRGRPIWSSGVSVMKSIDQRRCGCVGAGNGGRAPAR